jgi:transposase-like protein
MGSFPQTFIQSVQYFSDVDNCLKFLAERRWKDDVTCPTCGRKDVAFMATRRMWQCKTKHPKSQFSVKTGTILEDSPLGLDKWLPIIWLLSGCKNGISSCEVARDLGVTQKTAWFMLHRIRYAMQDEINGGKIGGPGCEIEADETYIGGKARNMHQGKRDKNRQLDNFGKAIVSAVLERHGEVRAKVIPNRRKKAVQSHVREHVEAGSTVYSDELKSYEGLDEYTHQVINHAETYVNGQIHTNGMENFWSLLKRGLKGTYVSVEPFHLFRYVDEQVFRYNNRKDTTDAERFELLCTKITGKRLTYDELIAKEDKQRAEDADF